MLHGATNTRVLRNLKSTLNLTIKQKEILFGTILGDGCLITSRSGLAARLQIRHNVKHQEYVEWKYKFFSDWVLTRPRLDPHNNSWYFRTVCHPDLMKIKKLFYQESGRFISENIPDILKSPLSLAVWFMDDGNGSKRSKYLRISSYGFGLSGNLLLKHCLEKNFSLEARVYKDTKGFQLFFPKESAIKLHKIVEPYIVTCMKYKFSNLTP